MAKKSFKAGFEMIPISKAAKVREEIMNALKIKNKQSFYRRKNGVIESRASEIEAIEQIFVKHGVPKSKIWGT